MKYDNIEINQDEFLRQVAEDSVSYLQEQGWSNKTKRAWQESLANIINGQIESSDVASTGQYAGQRVIHTTNNLNTESFNKKQNGIYSDVAWFLNQEMKKFTELKNQEQQKEAEKDTTLPKFTNEQFNIDLNKIISNDRYGGRKFTKDQWNSIDERDETGKRGTQKRSQLLVNYLNQYLNKFGGKYDFVDSPFENENDLRGRINDAIKSLEDGVWDQNDIDTLNRVGIDPDMYLSDGLNDVRGTINGESITYGQYNDLLQKQKEERIAQQNKENEEKRKAMLKKVEDAKREIAAWSLTNTPVTNTQESPKLKDVEFTTADKEEIGALIADIGSLVYPGAIGGAVIGTGAAGLRTLAAMNRGNVNFLDRLLDFGTGLVGGIPLVGDALMLGKVGKGVKAALQIAGVGEALFNTPGLSAVVGKINSGNYSDITVDEWKGMLQFFRGLTGAGRVYKSNRSMAKAAELSGLKVKNALWRKVSGYGPEIEKAAVERAIKAKVKVGDTTKDVNIPINEQQYNNLTKELSRTGQGKKGQARRQEIIKKIAEPEIKKMQGMSEVKSEDITIAYTPTWRNMILSPYKDNSSHFETTSKDVKLKTDDEFEAALKGRSNWDKFKNGSNRALREYRNKLGLSGQKSTQQTTDNNQQSQQWYKDQKLLPQLNPTPKPLPNLIGQKTINDPKVKSILEPPERLIKRQTKVIKKGDSHIIEAPDGSKINVSYNGSNIEVTHNGETNPLSGDLHTQKQQLSKTVNDITNKIITSPNSHQRTTEQWNKFVKGLLDAKKKGFFLKRGGMVKNKYIL